MPEPTRKRKKRKIRVGRLILLIVIIALLAALGATAGFVLAVARTVPAWTPADIEGNMTTFVYDAAGKEVAQLHGTENRIPVKLEQVPEDLVNAFIATEDHRFFNHHGVDPQAIVRAAVANLRSGTIEQGGSTITQQLAKNAFIEKPEKTLRRKVQEAILAFQLERTYRKEEILEFYLNQIYFGHGAYGVQAAAHTYFGKDISELDLAESALLAGLVKSPGNYSPLKEGNLPAAKARQAQVLDNMVIYGYLTPEQAAAAKAEKLVFRSAEVAREGYRYPYYIDYVTEEAESLLEENGLDADLLYIGGLKLYTALNTTAQTKMEEVYADAKYFPPGAKDRPVQSAMVLLDPHTGEIQALIGGREHEVRRGWNRATQTMRQPGSSIKPLVVYAPAVENGYPPATVVDDAPVTFPGKPNPYTPANYDGSYTGLINFREALRRSVNIVAVKTLNMIGVETGWQFGRELGLSLLEEDKHLPLALGGITKGVTPLEMAAAYGALANQGVWVEPHAIRRITDREGNVLAEVRPQQRAVMSEQTAYLVTDMLQTVVQSGTGTRAQMGSRPVAGKTGTTQLPDTPEFKGLRGNKDAWFAGYTPELVGVVWMGYDEPIDRQHYLRNVAGGSYPAQIWKAVMQAALKDVPVKEFPRPDNIVYVRVDVKSGLLPSDITPPEFIRTEIFTRETAPKKISDVWETADVCAESHQLATPYCPQVVKGIFLRRPLYEGVRVADQDLALPAQSCTVHGPGAGYTRLPICTDPRHGGREYLANIPQQEGQLGGCPPELIKYRPQQPGEPQPPPCPLPEHQLSVPGSGTISPPPSPELQARIQGAGIQLQWQGKKKDGELSFTVTRWSSEDPRPHPVATTSGREFYDQDVAEGITYNYQVTATDPTTGLSATSNRVTIIFQAPPP